jgi:LmbE family N-acetylglucosaminyl deacetylase
MRTLVIAPHPDDEVLGVGGTIARFAREGHEIHVAIVTKGEPDLFPAYLIEQGREEAATCHELLGVKETHFMDFPAARLDTVQHHLLNSAIATVISKVCPQLVFLPFGYDMHKDHRLVFESALVALRPMAASSVVDILCYETLSETNWNMPSGTQSFSPNVFVDISEFLETKLRAARAYASQMKTFPHERSIEAIACLAKLRGATIGKDAAESFVQVRRIV